MNKKQIQAYALLGIVAVVLSVILFIIPFEKGGVFWIAYIAELLALALQIPIFKLAYDGSETLKSRVLGFPIFRVGYMYLGVQSAVSLILIVLGAVIEDFPIWLALLFCIIVLAGALIGSIATDMARDEVVRIEEENAIDTHVIGGLKSKSAALCGRTDDPELKKELEKLAEAVKYSDPVSSPKIAAEELKLTECFAELENALSSGDTAGAKELCKKAALALSERNIACKNNK